MHIPWVVQRSPSLSTPADVPGDPIVHPLNPSIPLHTALLERSGYPRCTSRGFNLKLDTHRSGALNLAYLLPTEVAAIADRLALPDYQHVDLDHTHLCNRDSDAANLLVSSVIAGNFATLAIENIMIVSNLYGIRLLWATLQTVAASLPIPLIHPNINQQEARSV